jgi:hypothetical protein
MTEPDALPAGPSSDAVSGSPPARPFGLPRIAWLAAGIAVVAQTLCFLLVGVNAGLFFGGVLFATLLIPPMTLTERRFVDRMMIAWVVNDAIALVWMIGIFTSPLTTGQWVLAYIVLFAWSSAMLGVACLVERGLRGNAIVASALVVALALMWLTCPIWLARAMPAHPGLAHRIVSIHPLMAINGAVKEFGLWTERPIAYRKLMTLGQDLPTGLPTSILPATIVHLLLGICCVAASRGAGRR